LLSLYVFPHIHALNFKLPHEATDARLDLSRFQYYYLFLIPQVPLSSSIVLPYAEPSWSVGVEEIFYLFIPLVIFSTKRLQTVLIGLCALFIIFRAVSFASSTSPYEDPLTSFLIFSKYDCICIGCLAGVYFHRQRNFIEYIKKYIFTIAVIVLFLLTVTISRFAYQYIHFALLFAVIILYIARNPNNFLNNKLLQFYGKISFSLYMTHEIAIMLLLNKFDFSEYPPALLYLTGFLTATLLAFITYKIVEEPFLKIKNKIRLEDKSLTIPA
jgi:peptidoglycan/LPS O-acetylase OafA/YrhL